jgi:retron-type reverse transcriptase
MCTNIDRIAELAKENPKRQFFSIAHLITEEKLYEGFRSLRKDASAGVDGVTYEQYETNVEENIRQLHQRIKEGQYRAQPLRRVYIPKEDGKQRPISIPALEDKIVQKAVVDLLNAIYEQDFLPCSYGFRPGRGQHQALDEVGRGFAPDLRDGSWRLISAHISTPWFDRSWSRRSRSGSTTAACSV